MFEDILRRIAQQFEGAGRPRDMEDVKGMLIAARRPRIARQHADPVQLRPHRSARAVRPDAGWQQFTFDEGNDFNGVWRPAGVT